MSKECLPYYNADMHLRTLGGLELVASPFARPKPLLLLAYLALEGSKERRHLAELFWRDATDPLNRLAVTLARLRKAGSGLVSADHTKVWTDLATDAHDLLAAMEGGKYEEAVGLYRGPFLAGVYFEAGEGELEEWVYSTRDFLAGQVKTAQLALAEREAGEGKFQNAAKRAEAAYLVAQTAGLEPGDILRLHTLLLAGGHPRTVTLRAEAEMFSLEFLTTPDEARAALKLAAAAHAVPGNLPVRSTSFVGRNRELAELTALLTDADVRLVTIVGSAGVGKTRLALEAARQQQRLGSFTDGVYFVPLDALGRAADIPGKLAEILGVSAPDKASPVLSHVARHLGTKHLLLVLDNFEQLLGGVNVVADLLRTCPKLKLLVTSREALKLQEAWRLTLEGFPPVNEADVEHLLSAEAVSLFCQRARQAHPAFGLTAENAPGVRAICRLVEGLPLGLELAAAWVRVMPCAEIAAEIAKDLDFLASGTHNVAERHKSLRAAFEYSWRLLSPEEQEVLRKLAVFRGGFTREMGAEVAGATISVLASLVDKSLLRVDGQGRFDRHPLLYSYTLEKLSACPEEKAAAAARHAATFSALAGRLEREAEGSQPRGAYLRLEAELENFRTAWNWAVTHQSAPTLRACSLAFRRYFFNRGQDEELIELLTSALCVLDEADAVHQLTLANLLGFLGYVYTGLGRLDEAEKLAERGLALARPLPEARDDICGLFDCLLTLSIVARRRGQFRRAIAFLLEQEALGLFNERRLHSRGRHLSNLGLLETSAGDYTAAQAYLQRALTHYRQDDNVCGLVTSLTLLGDAHFYAGEAETARRYYLEAVALVRREGLGWGNDDFALEHLGKVALALGDFGEAQKVAYELLEKHPSPDEFYGGALEILGRVATAQGRFAEANLYLRQVAQLVSEPLDTLGLSQLGGLQDVLLSFTELWLKERRYTQAAAMLKFLLCHLHEAYARARAEGLLADVRLALSAEEFKAAACQSDALSLDMVWELLTGDAVSVYASLDKPGFDQR